MFIAEIETSPNASVDRRSLQSVCDRLQDATYAIRNVEFAGLRALSVQCLAESRRYLANRPASPDALDERQFIREGKRIA